MRIKKAGFTSVNSDLGGKFSPRLSTVSGCTCTHVCIIIIKYMVENAYVEVV